MLLLFLNSKIALTEGASQSVLTSNEEKQKEESEEKERKKRKKKSIKAFKEALRGFNSK
jgi:hypothetical protein